MDNVACSGSESSLADCQHNGWGKQDRSHNRDVSIECGLPTTTASSANGKISQSCQSLLRNAMHSVKYMGSDVA